MFADIWHDISKFFHEIKVSKRNVKESSAMVAKELINLWRRENLPAKDKQHVVIKIKNEIYEKLIRVKKNVRRDTKQIQKEQTYVRLPTIEPVIAKASATIEIFLFKFQLSFFFFVKQ